MYCKPLKQQRERAKEEKLCDATATDSDQSPFTMLRMTTDLHAAGAATLALEVANQGKDARSESHLSFNRYQ